MLLLVKDTMTPRRKLLPETMSMDLKEREGQAVFTTADMGDLVLDDWLKDDAEPGAGIVWRVKSINYNYPNDTPKITLEHVISMLKDRIIWGEVTPATITGDSNAKTCSAIAAIRYILGGQVDWVLGAFDYGNVYGAYKFDGDTLFDALESVSSSLPDCWWSYDLTSYPFKLNITRRQDDPATELRPGRNIRTISRNVDKSGMYTRFYPVGYDDLELPEVYVQQNENLYGVICKTETNTLLDTEEALRSWAYERLHDHCEPVVTITVEGLELAARTGESLDRMWLGRVARIPLTEFGTTFLERIVGLSWSDKVHQPEAVKVTLSNAREDVATIIADIIKSTGKSGRTSAKQSKEDHAWFEDTDEHVSMTAKAVIGTDAQGNPNWVRMSQVIVDGTGIHQTVESIQNDNRLQWTSINQNEEAIRMEASTREGETAALTVRANEIEGRVTDAEGNIGSLTVTAEALTGRMETAEGNIGELELTANEFNVRMTTAEGYYGTITASARKVDMVVGVRGDGSEYIKSADICVAINEDNSTYARINADKIYLLGQTIADTVTANYIATKVSNIANLNVNNVLAGGVRIKVTNQVVSPVATQLYVSGCVYDLQITQSGNTYTLQKKALGGVGAWEDVGSFSRATTLSGAWDSGTLTVTASPQGNDATFGLFDLRSQDVSWSGRTGTISVYANRDDGETRFDTGKRLTVTAPIQSQSYSHSWSSGELTVTGSPSGSETKAQIMDLRNQDVTWNGTTGTIAVYANRDGGETRYDTGKRLTVTAPVTEISLWEGNTKLSGSKSIWGSTTITAWCKVGGSWAEGDSVTFYHGGTAYQMTRGYDTDDHAYYGKLYRSDGTALTTGNYYWYGCTSVIGQESTGNFNMYM